MFNRVLHSDWVMILFSVSCAFVLLASILRLDELVATPPKRLKRWRSAFALDRDGELVLCDPDGQTWSRPAHRR